MRQTLGIPGVLGILAILTWVVGWLILRVDDPWIHALVPVGIVLLAAQMARRVAG